MIRKRLPQLRDVCRALHRRILITGAIIFIIHVAHDVNMLVIPRRVGSCHDRAEVCEINRSVFYSGISFHCHLNRFDRTLFVAN